MREFIKKNAIKLGVLIPILFSTMGIIIINSYLSDFGIVEYNFFRIQSVSVGAAFFVLNTLSFVVFCAYVDIIEPRHTGFRRIITLTISKIIYLSLILYNLFRDDYTVINIPGTDFTIGAFTIQCFTFIPYFILMLYYGYSTLSEEEVGKKIKTVMRACLYFINIPVFLVFCILVLGVQKFRNILFYMVLIAFGFLSILAGQIMFNDSNTVERESSIFSAKTSKKTFPYDVILALSGFLASLIVLTTFYAKNIYPYLPNNFGGGGAKPTVLLLDDGDICGKVIHSNTEFLFVLDKNKTVQIIKWDELKQIKLKE